MEYNLQTHMLRIAHIVSNIDTSENNKSGGCGNIIRKTNRIFLGEGGIRHMVIMVVTATSILLTSSCTSVKKEQNGKTHIEAGVIPLNGNNHVIYEHAPFRAKDRLATGSNMVVTPVWRTVTKTDLPDLLLTEQ